MRRLAFSLLLASTALAQSNVIQLPDQQSTPHVITLQAPATLASDILITLPVLNGVVSRQTSSGSSGAGGYIQIPPITYPNTTCLDKYGNPVNIPAPPPGYPAFGTNDIVIWNSESPLAGVSPPGCATPLPTLDNAYGLNVNTYILAQGGFATWLSSYAAITSWAGGMVANQFLAGVLYPAGTVTTTGTLSVPTYLGGHMAVGHSVGHPATGTIATVTNPLSGGEGLVQGDLYFDDGTGAFTGYNGSTWSGFLTTAGGQTISTVDTFTLGATGLVFNATATGTNIAFQTAAPYNFQVDGNGVVSAQQLNISGSATINSSRNGMFANLTAGTTGAAGVVQAWGAANTAAVFQVNQTGGSLTPIQMDGLGDISAAGDINITGATATYKVQGNQVINQSGVFNGAGGVDVAGTAYNIIQAPNGGLFAGLGVTSNQAFYPYGRTCSGLNTPASGYGGWSFQSGSTYCYWNGSAWAAVNLATSGGGSPGGLDSYVQFNNSGAFGGAAAFFWNNTTDVLTITGTVTSGVNAPVFSSSVTGTNVAFQTNGGTSNITGDGHAGFQQVTAPTYCIGASCITSWPGGGGGFSAQSVVTGSRSLGSSYPNPNPGATLVSVVGYVTGTGALQAKVGSSSPPTPIVSYVGATNTDASVMFLVPPGYYYEVFGVNASLFTWTEWN